MGDPEIHVSEQGQWKGFRRWQGNAGQKPAEPRDGASMVAILDGATKFTAQQSCCMLMMRLTFLGLIKMEKNPLQTLGERAEKGAAEIDARRRSALVKLGIAAVVAYTAPVILRLDRAEAAHKSPTFCLLNPSNPHCV